MTFIARIDEAEGSSRHLLIIMTRQEMQKLLDELDHKRVETRNKKIRGEPCDELACEIGKIEKESRKLNHRSHFGAARQTTSAVGILPKNAARPRVVKRSPQRIR